MRKKVTPKTSSTSGPVSFIPAVDFRAAPFADGVMMSFRAGVRSSPVPAGFVQEMRDKGRVAPAKTAADHG